MKLFSNEVHLRTDRHLLHIYFRQVPSFQLEREIWKLSNAPGFDGWQEEGRYFVISKPTDVSWDTVISHLTKVFSTHSLNTKLL